MLQNENLIRYSIRQEIRRLGDWEIGRLESNGLLISQSLISQQASYLSVIPKLAGKPTFRLQQTQFAGTCYGFGASLDLQFTKDIPIVPFNRTQGEEKSFANFTIGESLNNELEYF